MFFDEIELWHDANDEGEWLAYYNENLQGEGETRASALHALADTIEEDD